MQKLLTFFSKYISIYGIFNDQSFNMLTNDIISFEQLGLDVLQCLFHRSVQVVKWLALPTSDHAVPGLNPTGGGIQLMTLRCFIAQSLSLSPFHCLNMT